MPSRYNHVVTNQRPRGSIEPPEIPTKIRWCFFDLERFRPDVVHKIISLAALAPDSQLYNFLAQLRTKGTNQSLALWHNLDHALREELMQAVELPGNQWFEPFMDIIDPNHHWRLYDSRAAGASSASGQAGASSPPTDWDGASSASSRAGASSPTDLDHRRLSKKMTLLLRHPSKLRVGPDGFCKLSDMLRLKRFAHRGITAGDVQNIVRKLSLIHISEPTRPY